MKKVYVKIEGIHCSNCINIISNELLKNKKIKDVSINGDIATISYTSKLEKKEIIDSILSIDYITNEEYISDNIKDIDSKVKFFDFIIILGIIILLWFLINKIFGFNIFNVIPNIDSNITYGMLFVTGILTSIHCISMCGAINLMAVTSVKRSIKRPILYNLGRVISYTLVGGICGSIGSILGINDGISGIIIIIASIVMFLISLSMLGIIKHHLSIFNKLKIKSSSKNPFIIGLLNGLMPCGPLQAMQVYALSTGSFIGGALSMFLFSLGTVPLMLFVGIVVNIFKGKRKILINKIASILILILSIVMLNRGLLSLNIDLSRGFKNYGDFEASTIYSDYQEVKFDLSYNDYKDIIVQKGIPVRLIIHVDKNYLTGCNSEVVFRDFGVSKKLEEGDNIIEFTPKKEGIYTYTCWMEMITNNIKVIDDRSYFKEES